jgi:hypothetical protein
VESVVEGHPIDVTGIVRPAYPSASDRRPTLLPRSRGDIAVQGGATAGGSVTATTPSVATAPGNEAGGNDAGGTTASGSQPAATATTAGVPDADLADLASLVGTMVRVGGLVIDVRLDGFVLDDGTAHAPVVLRDEAADWIPLIEPDDAINVTGRIERLDDGVLAVVATDPAAIVLGSDPDAAGASASPGSPASPAGKEMAAATRPRTAGFGDDLGVLPGAGAGLASLFGVSLASIAVTLLRRRQARRLLASRVAARLSAIGSARPTTEVVGPSEDRPGGG